MTPTSPLAVQHARTAKSHRLKALLAPTEGEREHWEFEAWRFSQYADLADRDPEHLREIYRPARAYQPLVFTSSRDVSTARLRDAVAGLVGDGTPLDDATLRVAELACERFPLLDQERVLDRVRHAVRGLA